MNKIMEHLKHGHCRNGLLLGLMGLGLLLGVDVGVNILHWGLALVGLNTLLSDHWVIHIDCEAGSYEPAFFIK